jgi:hypothetical protein
VDEARVFIYLKKQTKAVLLERLRSAYAELSPEQRRAVFGEASWDGDGSGEAPRSILAFASPEHRDCRAAELRRKRIVDLAARLGQVAWAARRGAPSGREDVVT